MPSPAPHARGPGSSSGSAVWTASAPGSPPCSPRSRSTPCSTADAASCAGPGGTTATSSDTCAVFASSSAGILQPLMMPTPARELDVRRRRAEENEETFIGSFWKKTPPKKTTVSHRWNDYTFRSVMASQKIFQTQLVERADRRPIRSPINSRRAHARGMARTDLSRSGWPFCSTLRKERATGCAE